MDSKVCENIKMVTRYDWLADKYLGYLELKHLPVPGSITVYLQGQLIQPESFDACGNPIISEEMTKLFTNRQRLNFRNDSENNTEDIYARIYYEPQDFTVSKNEFDTVAGIQKSLVSLKTFNQMISNRRRYLKAFGKEAKLSEYVIWNKYILDKFGKIKIWNGAVRNPSTKDLSIMKAFSTLESFPDVYETSALSNLLNTDEHLAYDCEFYVPSEGSICPICGREISMYDLCTREFSRINGKYCHQKCLNDYKKSLQFQRIIDLIDRVYDGSPKYTIVENKNYECLILSFETPDGTIEINDSFGAVSIEWQADFKPFDMAIFDKNEEYKWWYKTSDTPFILGTNIPKNIYTNYNRGILARHSYNRAAMYLCMVKDAVNETK